MVALVAWCVTVVSERKCTDTVHVDHLLTSQVTCVVVPPLLLLTSRMISIALRVFNVTLTTGIGRMKLSSTAVRRWLNIA